jgi:hypothetical protein
VCILQEIWGRSQHSQHEWVQEVGST